MFDPNIILNMFKQNAVKTEPCIQYFQETKLNEETLHLNRRDHSIKKLKEFHKNNPNASIWRLAYTIPAFNRQSGIFMIHCKELVVEAYRFVEGNKIKAYERMSEIIYGPTPFQHQTNIPLSTILVDLQTF